MFIDRVRLKNPSGNVGLKRLGSGSQLSRLLSASPFDPRPKVPPRNWKRNTMSAEFDTHYPEPETQDDPDRNLAV